MYILDLYLRKNIFYLHSCIFLFLFSKRNDCIFEVKIYPLVIKYFEFLMIDNLISDPTKQIWINLEFYFESYEFSNY